MNTLRAHYRDFCLILALLVAGCDGGQPAGPAAQAWQVRWDAVAGASGYGVTVAGKSFATVETGIIVKAKAGEVLECWATDGGIRSAASKIVLGN